MKLNIKICRCLLIFISIITLSSCNADSKSIQRRHLVSLTEAHIGDLAIDTKLLDSYERLPENVRQFYFDSRTVFSTLPNSDFTHPDILASAQKNDMQLMGGPMLSDLKSNKVSLWLRPASAEQLIVKVKPKNSGDIKTFSINSPEPGIEQRMVLGGLKPNTEYQYKIYYKKNEIAQGHFKTAPVADTPSIFRLAFGSCFHKIGLHNPNHVNQILTRNPHAMAVLGDIAVDDRENNYSMHRSDYLLRDVSKAWSTLAANVPLFATWDDHDYLNNDLSGIPEKFTENDRDSLRAVWQQNWNNPKTNHDGIYFNTRMGPVELIMLDTRSCRKNEKRGEYASYLGEEQQNWLKETLLNSTAPFKVISSGTMWSDYVTKAKDSWGSWDIHGREEIFNLIENENISGVLLISGDRHGARGFKIPRSSGFDLYEFEAATLGGVPGPPAMAPDSTNQLFGYHGTDTIAFGEFTFDTTHEKPRVTFRLIGENGIILENFILSYDQLTPKK